MPSGPGHSQHKGLLRRYATDGKLALEWDKVNIQETGRQAASALLSPADCSEHGHIHSCPLEVRYPSVHPWASSMLGASGWRWTWFGFMTQLWWSRFIQPFTHSINAYQEPLLCLFAGTVLDVRTQAPCIMEFTL